MTREDIIIVSSSRATQVARADVIIIVSSSRATQVSRAANEHKYTKSVRRS